MSLVLVIDDEPMYTRFVVAELQQLIGSTYTAVGLDRPRNLSKIGADEKVSHALVDISFGNRALDQAWHAPEIEHGVDAVWEIQRRWPGARLAVVSRLDTSLNIEIGRVIRETWPSIRFLYKHHQDCIEQMANFVSKGIVVDNLDLAEALGEVPKVEMADINRVFDDLERGQLLKTAWALSEFPHEPSYEELEPALGTSLAHKRNRISALNRRLDSVGFGSAQIAAKERVWLWCYSRRVILANLVW